MVIQLDRLNCLVCDNKLEMISLDGKCFPKGTIYLQSVKIPLENTPLRYHSFFCDKCESITKCLTIVSEDN